MSKSAGIKKKALEFAKRGEWERALKEYRRLVEVDSHNPNVYNELGDIHLKMSNRGEAFSAFHEAIDEYASMSLYNNAVAVCKKILRLNPNDSTVYGKLARLRGQQGFTREAESHALMFLERVVQDATLKPEELKERVEEVANAMKDSPIVHLRVAELLIKWEFKFEAGPLLQKAERGFTKAGLTDQAVAAHDLMNSLGYEPTSAPAESDFIIATGHVDLDAASRLGAGKSSTPSRGVHEYGDLDIEAGSEAAQSARSATAVEIPPEPVAEPEPESDIESDETAAAGDEADTVATLPDEAPDFDEEDLTRTAEMAHTPFEDIPAPVHATKAPPSMNEVATAESNGDELADGPAETAQDEEIWVPASELPDPGTSAPSSGEYVKVSEIVGRFDAEVKANVDPEDYRSHYDLGMAYLEMDLLSESIREFQSASKSSQYQVRSIEMIGLCFLKQDKPRLAVKQLERGLSLVNGDEREAIGLQYNLGLAYELTGDIDKARTCFEDVYVLDVTFREVAEKYDKYSK